MGSLFKCLVRAKDESALAEYRKEVLKRTNDDFIGRLACCRSKKIGGQLKSFFFPLLSIIGFALNSQRYIENWASVKVLRFNSDKNTKEREFNRRSETFSVMESLQNEMFLLCPKSHWHFLLEETTLQLHRKSFQGL